MPLSDQPPRDHARVPEDPAGDQAGAPPCHTAARYASFTAATSPTPAARSPLTASDPT
ncbi:hypothetical protein [Actinomadura luteofluorescens]|uniref:hypothetical protein n=1 Tax=Actinomadura luteofluorescens TaxID=46163 RepID=UPI003D94C763